LYWFGIEEIGFGLTGIAWSRRSRFLPDSNVFELSKLGLTWLEWLGMEEVGFGLTGMFGTEKSVLALPAVKAVLGKSKNKFWPA
jgi:hypothetical protein